MAGKQDPNQQVKKAEEKGPDDDDDDEENVAANLNQLSLMMDNITKTKEEKRQEAKIEVKKEE